MAVINPPAWMQGGEYPARIDRLVPSSIVAEPGTVRASDLEVLPNPTPGMSVVVSRGHAWIRDGVGSSADQGLYNFVNDGDVVLPIGAAHATNHRYDRVIAEVRDSELSGSDDDAIIRVLPGTNSGTDNGALALAPAVPVRAVNRGLIHVRPGTTSIVAGDITKETSVAKLYSEMSAVPVVCTSSTRPLGADRFESLLIYETDTKRMWQWNGTVWQFRGGPGPRAYVSRPGTWSLPTGDVRYLSSLEPVSGNFEEAYYVFVDTSSSTIGDRIRVKQAGMYAVEMHATFTNSDTNFNLILGAYIAVGSSSLPSNMVHFPALSGRYLQGLNRAHDSRTVFLAANTEIAIRYDVNVSGTSVDEIGLGLTLIG